MFYNNRTLCHPREFHKTETGLTIILDFMLLSFHGTTQPSIPCCHGSGPSPTSYVSTLFQICAHYVYWSCLHYMKWAAVSTLIHLDPRQYGSIMFCFCFIIYFVKVVCFNSPWSDLFFFHTTHVDTTVPVINGGLYEWCKILVIVYIYLAEIVMSPLHLINMGLYL